MESKTKTGKDGKTYEVSYPVQDDHFVLTDAPEIASVYGETPKEIDVLFPFPDVQRNFDAHYCVWAGGVLVCKGDGEQVLAANPFRVEEKNGRVGVYNAPGDTLVDNGVALKAFSWNGSHFEAGETVPCPGAKQGLYPHCAACSPSSMLKVMLAHQDLIRFGYYQISTGSGRNYDTLLGTMEEICKLAGRVNGIPFKLRIVEEATLFQDAAGQRKQTKRFFLQLEPQPELIQALYRKTQAALVAEPGGYQLHALPMEHEPEPEDYIDADGLLIEEPAPPPVAHQAVAEGPVKTSMPPTTPPEPPTGPQEAPGTVTRPYPPTILKERMDVRAAWYQGQGRTASDKQRGLVAMLLEKCFAGDPQSAEKRHAVLKWLFAKESLKEIDAATVLVFLNDILVPTKDAGNNYEPAALGVQEIRAVYAQAVRDAGQLELGDFFPRDKHGEPVF
jgi:hypothetical protein